jgi:shikimate 5-dehydrogenase
MGLESAHSLDDLPLLAEFDVLVNTTSVGYRDASRSPLTADQIPAGITVMDIVAEPQRTRLIELAAEKGCSTIPGTRMRVLQAAAQFEHYTGVRPPLDAMEEAMVDATNAQAGE